MQNVHQIYHLYIKIVVSETHVNVLYRKKLFANNYLFVQN